MTDITIATTLPASDAELQTRLRNLRAWKATTVADITAAKDAITTDNYRTLKLNEFDGADKRLKECADAVAREATPDWAKALLVEITATRAEVKAAVEERKDKLRAVKAEVEPPRLHTYVIRMTCTDAVLSSLTKKAVKDGAADVLATTPQSDKAVKQIAKWFEENV